MDIGFIQLIQFFRLYASDHSQKTVDAYVSAMAEGDAKVAARFLLEGKAEHLRPKLGRLLADAAKVVGVEIPMHPDWYAENAVEPPSCTCGSGGHPRKCEKHPKWFDIHCGILNLHGLAEDEEMADAIDDLEKKVFSALYGQ